MSSVNKVIIVGNLGNDPEIRTMQSGDKMAQLSIATSERWKDKQTGERREKTEWHRVVVFNKGIVSVAENYLKKGSKVYVEGQLETRSWEQDGQKKYTTEVVLRPYRGELTMLDSRNSGGGGGGGSYDQSGGGGFNQNTGNTGFSQNSNQGGGSQASAPSGGSNNFDDEIPF